jgi:metal-responsive CopG/Arc/MetJ family transcriptional regulator
MLADLLARFDRLMTRQGYETRSGAVRALIRGHLVEVTAERAPCEMAGTVTLIYDWYSPHCPHA